MENIAHPQSGSWSTWFLVELEFGNVGFWEEGRTGVPGEKPLGAKERTNNKLNPHMASMPGFEPRPHWWEASTLTTAPPPPLPLAPCYCCNCTVLKVWINHKARTFSWLCHNHRSHLLGVLSLFADWNDRFPYLLINFKLWRASCMGYYREYSPGIC